MGSKIVALKIDVSVDGELEFFSKDGQPLIPAELKMDRNYLIPTINEMGLQAYGSISFFSMNSNEGHCKIVIELPDGTEFCFIVDCTSGTYIGPCS